MKNKTIAAILSLILILNLTACSLPGGITSQPSETQTASVNTDEITPSSTVSRRTDVPEDIKSQDKCVLAYFDALKKNDANKIIQISSGSKFEETDKSAMGSDFIGELQSITATSDLMHATYWFIYSILSDYDNMGHDSIYSKENIDEFIREIDPARLADIKVLELGTPLEPPQMPDGLQLDISVISQRYCLFSIGGKTLFQLFWLVKSPDGYRLVVIGRYNGYSFNGYAKPISQELFEALVDPETIHEPSQELLASIPESSGETTYLQKIKATSSPSLNSPEKVIDCFAKALASRDTYAALSTFSIKEKAENFDFDKMSEDMGAFLPYEFGLMIPEYDFYRDMNLAINCSEAAKGIISLMFYFNFDFDLESKYSTLDYFSAIQKSCDELSSLSVIRSDVIAKSTTERGREIGLKQAARFGADNMEHRVFEYSFNDEKFTGALVLINYDGNWRIQELSSAYLDLSVGIPVVPSTKVDYDSYI